MKVKFIIAIILSASLIKLVATNSREPVSYGQIKHRNYWIDSVYNSLSVKERIAQLIMVNVSSNWSGRKTAKIDNLIKKYNIGGLIFFQGGPVRQVQLTNHFQKLAKIPILIALDAEWGPAMRLDSVAPFPHQMQLGAIQDNGLIYDMGVEIARQCKLLGVNVNFAPVVDINNNPNNPVINSRSFGENKHKVLKKAYSYMQGMLDNGIIVTAKHFPGHGDTDTDSHHNLPVIKHNLTRLNNVELYPYKYLIKLGLNGIMVAHLQVNALDNRPHRPSSISKPTVTNLLRNKLKFQGLIFTDALNMKGVSAYYPSGRIAVEALKAGCDILLYPANPEKAILEIAKAIKSGEISNKELEQHCKRVLEAKYNIELQKFTQLDTKNLIKNLNTPKTDELSHWFGYESITCLKNNNNLLPLSNEAINSSIAVVTIGNSKGNMFHLRLSKYCDPDYYYIPKNALENKLNNIYAKCKKYSTVIVYITETSNSPYKRYGLSPNIIKATNKFAILKNNILFYPGNPYALDKIKNLTNYNSILVGYQDNEYTRDYGAQTIMGGISAQGTLPVSTSSFKYGTTIKTEHTRLGYVDPCIVNAQKSKLVKIDSIAISSIQEKATPGCVIIAAKDGYIFYHKPFGYQTYNKTHPISENNIYDFASITKVVATTLSLMHFYEDNKFDLNKTIGDYLPLSDTSIIAKLKFIDVMTHQARLKSWIPFYKQMLDSTNNIKPKFLSHKQSKQYPIQVAKNLFASINVKDTIYKMMDTTSLREQIGYKYSDMGFYFLFKIVSKLSNMPFQDFVSQYYYTPMFAKSLTFNPLNKFSKTLIVPTEEDTLFRKQLIHGYVHDPGAALLGGVSGHAGLFGNITDLAKLGQMLLNKGTYGGQRFLKPETIKKFITAPFRNIGNRRAIGFDKPEYRKNYIGPTFDGLPLVSFGHSGFTGTYIWCDPKNDILYVFLSNRINPTASNKKLIHDGVRTKIHRLIYQSLFPNPAL